MFIICVRYKNFQCSKIGIYLSEFGLIFLFSAEIRRNLSPFFRFPFQDTGGIGILPKPFFRPFY